MQCVTVDPVRNSGLFRACGEEEIEQFSREGSHYSISTGILPSLGARSSNRRLRVRWFIISPYDRRHRFENFHIIQFFFNICVVGLVLCYSHLTIWVRFIIILNVLFSSGFVF